MNTHNIGFYEDLTKIIFQLSSNMHFISSSGTRLYNSTGVIPKFLSMLSTESVLLKMAVD